VRPVAPRSSLDRAVSDAKVLFRTSVRSVQADRLLDATKPSEWAPRPLSSYNNVRVAGMGKAALAMAGTVEDRERDVVTGGSVVVPETYPDTVPQRLPRPSQTEVRTAGHPLPTDDGVRAGRQLLEEADTLEEDDLLLTLISGGGTALSTVPAGALDLADLKATYHHLLMSGVPIEPANTVRKHLTQVGGGQLARAAEPADVGALVVSDVVGNDLSTIASGPTVPDPSTYEDAVRVLYQHDLWREVPEAVRTHLTDGARDRHPETPRSEETCFDQTRTTLVGTNKKALRAARTEAEKRGYHVQSVTTGLTGEARDLGRAHAECLLDANPDEPTVWLWGGEPTVTVTGNGTGGRNQEVALGAALALHGTSAPAVVLSGGTDGIDGPTDAAGGWASPETVSAARSAGFDPESRLTDNDSYSVLDALGQLLRPGPTHTNVMDIHVGLIVPAP